MMDAVDDYNQTHRTGFQQPGRPQFLFAHKQNKYSLALGGFIALRTSYDFDGTPSATDFIPSSIPVPGDYASRQRLSMDASTSRIYLKGIANTRALGRVVVYVSTDFRGGAQGSYTPRLREAYVSFKGFTFGRDVTTFCDLDAGPTTIDFQGPNAYNFTFATMIRYEVPFANDHLKFGLAAEPAQRERHVRRDVRSDSAARARFSGLFPVCLGGQTRQPFPRDGRRARSLSAQCRHGEQYLPVGLGRAGEHLHQSGPRADDLRQRRLRRGHYQLHSGPVGTGLRLHPRSAGSGQVQTMPMWGWYGAARINILPQRLFISGGYSEAHIQQKHGYFSGDQYRNGQYIFGNIFYNFTSRCSIAAEYLYGSRENRDGMKNHANRVSMQVQYNF